MIMEAKLCEVVHVWCLHIVVQLWHEGLLIKYYAPKFFLSANANSAFF